MLRTYPVNFDLLVAIPPHVSPKVVLESGLSDNNSSVGWIQVDPKTMQTKHDNVFAIGDVAAIHGTFLYIEKEFQKGGVCVHCVAGRQTQ